MIQQRLSRAFQSLARQQQQCFKPYRSPLSSPSASTSFAPSSQCISARRWYSEANETKKEDASTEEPSKSQIESEEATAAKDDPVQKELEAKKKEALEATDRYKRTVADYRNLQDQTKREVQAAKDFALQRFSKDLLESIDNLDRALENVPAEKLTQENQDLVNLHSGLEMTQKILLQTLGKHGLVRVDPSVESEVFNPNMHEAVFQAPQPDKKDGTVFFTQQKGFTLNGRVIRPSKVGVVKNS